MKLDQQVLCKRATDLELKQQKRFQNNLEAMSVLEPLLLDVYATLRPEPQAYELRKLLVQVFNIMAKDIFGGSNGFPTVEAFGSFTMDLFTDTSDLDLSLNFNDEMAFKFPRERKISVLMKFARALYSFQNKGHVSGVFPIMRARVPIVKVVDCGTGIECDISVENKDGISRSSIFAIVSSIDERFRILCHLIKFWAKVHNINSAKDHTLNSLTIISLVAFHLQTRDPPILPPFSTLFKDGADIASVQNVAFGLKSFGQRNKESVAGLFVTLLNKLSAVESLWQHGLCASVYEGSWISKRWKSGVGAMSVEDYLDRSENFARAVRKNEMHKIYMCIHGSLDNLSAFMNGRCDASMLKKCLFEFIPLKKPLHQLTNGEKDLKRKYPFDGSATPLSEDTFTNRRRFVEAGGEGRWFVEGGGERTALYESLRNTSFPHLPITRQMPAASSWYIQRMHPLEPPVNPSQWASQTGYHAEHHSHHPFAQLSYQSGNLSLPLVPSLFQSCESTNNLRDHHLTLHRPSNNRSTIPSLRYSNQDIRRPFH